jgi:tRNA(Arg) A34 adenosine deaminase TadA
MSPESIILTAPDWLNGELAKLPSHFPTVKDRMMPVIRFSQINVERDTGGPFAAGIFERDSGKLIVIGVNRVVPNQCSSAHAEVMALSFAQRILNTYDLGAEGLPPLQLVVNCRPCVMCYGATIWSGVRSLAIAVDGPDMEKITGFDEGPMRADWPEQLAQRGIEVITHVARDEACEVFRLFREKGRCVYGPRQGRPEA